METLALTACGGAGAAAGSRAADSGEKAERGLKVVATIFPAYDWTREILGEETDASFETIIFLADKADELGIDTILTIEGQDHIIENECILCGLVAAAADR